MVNSLALDTDSCLHHWPSFGHCCHRASFLTAIQDFKGGFLPTNIHDPNGKTRVYAAGKFWIRHLTR